MAAVENAPGGRQGHFVAFVEPFVQSRGQNSKPENSETTTWITFLAPMIPLTSLCQMTTLEGAGRWFLLGR